MKRSIPLPKGYTWQDISYVIGGAYKKVRFVNKQGFIITAAKNCKPYFVNTLQMFYAANELSQFLRQLG